MATHLEKIPRDILQHIALLGASSTIFDPPRDLFHLLLTSSTLNRSLAFHACPSLYANIFRTKFDVTLTRHRFRTGLTDSALTAELLLRCRTLRRSRLRDLSGVGLRQDLWTALGMILESNGLNETQLSRVGFSQFIIAFVRSRFSKNKNEDDLSTAFDDTDALAVWLLCLSLSRYEVLGMPVETRTEILGLLHRFTVTTSRAYPINDPASLCPLLERSVAYDNTVQLSVQRTGPGEDTDYSGNRTCPNPFSAAIILTFALKEAIPLDIPPHLPKSRDIAIATQRSGPTMEDFNIVTHSRTPLFVDSCPVLRLDGTPFAPTGVDMSRSAIHDPEFRGLGANPSAYSAYSYLPGMLTGLWEGNYMVADTTPSSTEFTCRKPMQCSISEYLCFSPHIPLPSDDSFDLDLSPCRLLESEDGFEISSRKYRYEKYSNTEAGSYRKPSQALDMIITGETLEKHEQAWGGFKFAGRIRRDGLIIMKREPKNADDASLGTWLFEGQLRYGAALVGRWQSSTSSDSCGIHGIFSMHKKSCT